MLGYCSLLLGILSANLCLNWLTLKVVAGIFVMIYEASEIMGLILRSYDSFHFTGMTHLNWCQETTKHPWSK